MKHRLQRLERTFRGRGDLDPPLASVRCSEAWQACLELWQFRFRCILEFLKDPEKTNIRQSAGQEQYEKMLATFEKHREFVEEKEHQLSEAIDLLREYKTSGHENEAVEDHCEIGIYWWKLNQELFFKRDEARELQELLFTPTEERT